MIDTLSLQFFWDKLAADLSLSNPCWSRVFNLLGDIRVNLVAYGSEAVGAVAQELIDIDFIRQQMERGVFGWEEWRALVARVYGVLKNVQSAERAVKSNAEWLRVSEEVEAQGPARKFCSAFRFLRLQSFLLQIDDSNARWIFLLLFFLCNQLKLSSFSAGSGRCPR
jgi:hypothetical protein